MPKTPVKIDKYFNRSAIVYPLANRLDKPATWRRAVIIPALAESRHLPATLQSLAANSAQIQRETIVLVTVNQPPSPKPVTEGKTEIDVAEDNQATLQWLRENHNEFEFKLTWIDAASPGRELPAPGGVGLARKAGCDSLLHTLFNPAASLTCQTCPISEFLVLHLDADTIVDPGYLTAAAEGLADAGTEGGVVDFEHQIPADPVARAAVQAYERYLKYVVRGLQAANSPYAFHTIGSTMVCTAAGYIRAGGIQQKRQAGEDFYFLQQLAKTGGVSLIHAARVHPSARLSARNPYGTGPAVAEILSQGINNYKVFAPDSFYALQEWLEAVRINPNLSPEQIVADIERRETRHFVMSQGFAKTWRRLQKQHENIERRLKAFDEWFDALATIRLLRHLARTEIPPVPLAIADSIL